MIRYILVEDGDTKVAACVMLDQNLNDEGMVQAFTFEGHVPVSLAWAREQREWRGPSEIERHLVMRYRQTHNQAVVRVDKDRKAWWELPANKAIRGHNMDADANNLLDGLRKHMEATLVHRRPRIWAMVTRGKFKGRWGIVNWVGVIGPSLNVKLLQLRFKNEAEPVTEKPAWVAEKATGSAGDFDLVELPIDEDGYTLVPHTNGRTIKVRMGDA